LRDFLSFLSWYGAITLVGVISFPIAFRFFPKLGSRGYALVRPISLLIWGFIFWLFCSLGVLQNDLGGVLVSLGVLLVFSAILLQKERWIELKDWVRQNWRLILVAEIVFLVLFASWTVVRAANPDAAYTEKPMELAFINSILLSPNFPPQDPWLSGYAISYYYFGYILVSLLIRVTGVASSVAFNLSSSLWFALTGTAAFGIVHDLLKAWKNGHGDGTQANEPTLKSGIARIGGLLGPFFLLIIGNLEGFLELLYARRAFWKVGADGALTSGFWNWLGILELNTAPTQPVAWILNRTNGWLWWRGSRVIQDLGISGGNIEVIDEFPFFTYLISDLHPHLLAMPFCLLALALALNAFLARDDTDFSFPFTLGWLRHWQSWMTFLILGSLAFLNTWDFPIYVGLFAVIVIYKRVLSIGWSWRRVWEFIQCGIILGIGGVVLFLPFYLGFQSQAGGILPSLEYITRGINFWVMFGVFLSLIIIWLIIQIREKKNSFSAKKGLLIVLYVFLGLFLASMLWGLLILNLSLIGISLSASLNPVIAAYGEKLIFAGQLFAGLHGNYSTATILQEALLRRIYSPGTWLTLAFIIFTTVGIIAETSKKKIVTEIPEDSRQLGATPSNIKVFILILIFFGAGLTLFPEFFYLRDQFGSRMNTIFKFYFQAWIFWSIAVAFISVELFNALKRWRYMLFSIFWVILITAGMAYPVLMVLNKTNNFSPAIWTLDGNEYISRYTPDDYLAMQWLRERDTGIIAEAVGGSYTDFARISTRTGFPTVLGWPGHESQWRGGATEMGIRAEEIARMYETELGDEAVLIVEKYQIRYIYLGNLERTQYNVNQSKFDTLFDVIYSNASVTIYEVPGEYGGMAIDGST